MEKSRVFGGKCTESLASYDQESLSWRTCQLSLFGGYQMYSDRFPQSGMMQNGVLYQLHNLELPTCEKDGFVLPTPASQEGGMGDIDWEALNPEKGINQRFYTKQGSLSQKSLSVFAKNGLLPTPTAVQMESPEREERAIELAKQGLPLYTRRIKNGKKIEGARTFSIKDALIHRMMLPTPTTIEKSMKGARLQGNTWIKPNGEKEQTTLTGLAFRGMLPTPTCNDSKNKSSTPSQWDRHDSLNVEAAKMKGLNKETTGSDFQLNPHFVTEMMGFPIDWLDLEP